MKTTLDLPDDLLRMARMRAAREDRTFKDVVTEALRHGLANRPESSHRTGRAGFPLITNRGPALPPDALSPDELAGILNDQDVQDHSW